MASIKKKVDYQKILSEIVKEQNSTRDVGKVASYIPGLNHIDPKKLGVHLTTTHKEDFSAGDANERFSIQSISKVLFLALAFKVEGDKLWNRVGIEPSGTAFNSLVQLEYEKGIPRNPFINAGAIVICDVLVSHFDNPKVALLEFISSLSRSTNIGYNPKVAETEKTTSFKNNALINLMKDFGNIHNDIDAVLDVYFYFCSLEMSCKELSHTFLFLASNGLSPITNKPAISPLKSKRINSIMQLCGFYDEAGEFAFKVGLPGKSGVGGGIIAILPGIYSIAVWSPKLNKNGNSYKGMKVLEAVTTKTQCSIF